MPAALAIKSLCFSKKPRPKGRKTTGKAGFVAGQPGVFVEISEAYGKPRLAVLVLVANRSPPACMFVRPKADFLAMSTAFEKERPAQDAEARGQVRVPYSNGTVSNINEKAPHNNLAAHYSRNAKLDIETDYLANIDGFGGLFRASAELEADGIPVTFDAKFDVIETRATEAGKGEIPAPC